MISAVHQPKLNLMYVLLFMGVSIINILVYF